MPSKKINQLETRVLSATDLMLVGDPSTGVSFKSLISGLGSVYVPNSTTITINGTTLNLTTNRSWSVGSVTSVNMSVPTGLTISGNPITNAGTLALGLASGYTIPTQALLDGKVPYIGATANVDLGEYELKAGQLTLDISPTGTAAVGTTRWNNTIGSSETTLKGGSVILKNGVDLVARVVNKVSPNTTLTKAAYQAVRVTGAQGQRLAVAYAQANNDNNSADTIGLVCETIATNQEGFIITAGQIENINTTGSLQGETWVDGDVLYLSPSTPGAITNIKPVAPQHLVIIGYVEYAHQNNGKIYVKVMNGWELGELHDVNTTGAVNGNVLKYNGSIWVPSSDIDTGITSLNGLTALSQTFATGTSGTDFGISSSSSTHTFNIPSASATNRGALTSADWTTFNNKQSAGNYITALTGEVTASGPGSASATLLNSAVTGKVLTGLNLTGGGTISATDTILQAFGKTQNQISALVGGVMYEGVWNASTNTPTIVSSVGAKGDYYVVNVAGSVNIDGINDWKIGDWIIFNGTNWEKVDNTDAVSSVNGFTGAVSLTTANISEVTNLYFTDQRVMSAMLTGYTIGSNTAITFNDSVLTAFGKAQAQINTKQNIVTLTTTGSSGSATFVSDTLNVPTYTLAGLGGQPQLNGTGFVKISGTTISYDNSTYYLASNPNSFIALTALSAGTGISYSNTTGVITNTAPDQVVSLIAGSGISVSGTYPSFTIASTITQYTDALARLAISESATGLDYNNTTGVFSLTSGYVIPTTSSASNWDTSYNNMIVSAAVTGTTTKTLTLTQQDAGTITASWTDINTDAVNSVFGRTGAVVAVSGDYTTAQVTESGNLYYTDGRVSANTDVAANTAARHNAVTIGTGNGLSLSVQALSLALSSASTTGALSSTDWTTFNSKQAALSGTGFVKISGTTISYDNTSYLPLTGGTLSSASSAETLRLVNTGTGYGLYNQANSFFQGDVEFQSVTSTLLKVDSSHKLIAAVAGTDYQAPITNPVTGTGTTNYLPKWTSGTAIGDSQVFDNGTNVGIGTTNNGSDGGVVPRLAVANPSNADKFVGIGYDNTGDYGFIHSIHRATAWKNLAIQAFGGNVLVGTTTDAGYKLDVNGTGRFTGARLSLGDQEDIVSTFGLTLGANANSIEMVASNFAAGYGAKIEQSDPGDGSTYTRIYGRANTSTWTQNLSINNTTGAATFSSSVTAGSSMYTNDIGINTTTIGAKITVFSSTSPNLGMSLEPVGWNGAKHRFNVPTSGDASMLSFNWNGSVADYVSYATSAIGISNGILTFSTASSAVAPTERARFTSGGNLLVGTTTDSGYKLNVNGGIYGKGITADSDGGVGNALYAYNQVLSGSSTNALIQLATTWNTTGNADAIVLDVTNTASGASSRLIDLKVGGSSIFKVQRNGRINASSLPTSSAGLSAGDIWNDGGTLKIV